MKYFPFHFIGFSKVLF
jgi:hypothetical protein